MRSYTWVWGSRWRGLGGSCLNAAWWTYSPATQHRDLWDFYALWWLLTLLWVSKLKYPRSSETCQSHCGDTYSYFTQVDPIIQRVPGTLLVVGPPGLLEDLINALAFLTFEPVTAWDARRPRDAVGSRVTVSARGACWPLQATAILEKKQGREEEVVGADNEKKAHNNICRVYCYLTSCFTFSLSSRGDKFLFVLHATQTPECCQSSNHHTQQARLYLFNQSYKQIQCLGAEVGAKTDVIQTKAKPQNKHTMEPWSKWTWVLMRNWRLTA